MPVTVPVGLVDGAEVADCGGVGGAGAASLHLHFIM